MKILFLGEVVGKGGVYAIKKDLDNLVSRYDADFVVVNGDSATRGNGIGKSHCIYLRKLGINALTGGDKIYSKEDFVLALPKLRYVLRPANFSSGAPGSGLRVFSIGDQHLVLINLLGQVWHNRSGMDSPAQTAKRIIERLKVENPYIVIDYHSRSTAEKQSLFHFLDGKVSAICGSGQKVQTTDEGILPGGTAFITDVGICGSKDGVSGYDANIEIKSLLTGIMNPSRPLFSSLMLQGVIIDIGNDFTACSIKRFEHAVQSSEVENQAFKTIPNSD